MTPPPPAARGADTPSTDLPAGRELDALVAEKVMGWMWKRDQDFNAGTGRAMGPPYRFLVAPDDDLFAGMEPANGDEVVRQRGWHPPPPRYSTDIAAAWQLWPVVHGWLFSRRRVFWHQLQMQATTTDGTHVLAWPEALLATHADFPAMICRAALAAVSP